MTPAFTRRRILLVLAPVAVLVSAGLSVMAADNGDEDVEWRHYGGDRFSSRYSQADQIDADSIANLRVVWRWNVTDADDEVEGESSRSLVALNANTGERVWHFQGVHHGIWDYDFPCPPNLVDITVDGRKIKAVAQLSKQGFTYVFDRVTGEPVWPIEERAVPAIDSAPATAPMTYVHKGKQYIVFATNGQGNEKELVAFALR